MLAPAEEFPGLGRALAEPLERRQILKLMAAAFVMAGLGGCDAKFGENLIPGVKIPPNIIPGLPNFYATAHVLDGFATGILVKHRHGPADQRARKRQTSGEPGGDRRICASAAPRFLRSGPRRTDQHPRRALRSVQALRPHSPPSARALRRNHGQGPASFNRHRDLAHARGAARCAARAIPASAMDSMGADQPRCGAGGSKARVREARRCHRAARSGRCASCDRERSLEHGAGALCAMRAISRAGAIRAVARP